MVGQAYGGFHILKTTYLVVQGVRMLTFSGLGGVSAACSVHFQFWCAACVGTVLLWGEYGGSSIFKDTC